MWLSERFAGDRTRPGTEAGVGTVTIGGANAAVLLSGEKRDLGLLRPGGIDWQPEKNDQVMVLQTSDGERFILGTVSAGTEPLADGELCLSCGDTKLKLGRDGINITGRLFLNGIEIDVGEET